MTIVLEVYLCEKLNFPGHAEDLLQWSLSPRLDVQLYPVTPRPKWHRVQTVNSQTLNLGYEIWSTETYGAKAAQAVLNYDASNNDISKKKIRW